MLLYLQVSAIVGAIMKHSTPFYNSTDVPSCFNSPLCLNANLQFPMIAMSFLSLSVNIFHLVVLASISSLKRSPFMTVMNAIATADILYSISSLLILSCKLRRICRASYFLSTLLSSQMSFSFCLRYFYLATALVERLLSTYRRSLSKEALNQLHWVLIGEAFALVIVLVIQESLYYRHICYSTVAGPINASHPATKIINSIALCAPLGVMLIAIPMLSIQLYRLSKKSVTNTQKSIVAATKYVIITGLMFLLFPFVIIVRVVIYEELPSKEHLFNALLMMAQSLYGILNTVIYGLMSKVYRKQLYRLKNKISSIAS